MRSTQTQPYIQMGHGQVDHRDGRHEAGRDVFMSIIKEMVVEKLDTCHRDGIVEVLLELDQDVPHGVVGQVELDLAREVEDKVARFVRIDLFK